MPRFARVPVKSKSIKGLSEDAVYAGTRFGGGTAAALTRGSWDIEKADSEGFKKVTWVFRSIDVIASAQADRMIQWRRGDRRTGEVVPHELDTLLNSSTNLLEDAWQFRYRLSCQLLLSTRGVFLEVIRDRVGRVSGLGLLPPQWTKPVPHPTDYIAGFEVRVPGTDGLTLPREKVVWIRKPDPLDPLKAVTPLQAAGLSVDMDWLLHVYNRTFLINDGRPGGLIVVKGDMEETDKEELRARFGGSVNRAGRVSVIASDDGADWVDTAVTPRDAQYGELAKMNQEEILLAFGVPKSQMGDASGRTYDNADAEDGTFWEKTMFGHNGLIARGFDQLDEDPEVLCSFDYSDVDALIASEYRRRAGLLLEYQAGTITKNEYRVATGRDPVEGGDSYVGAGGLGGLGTLTADPSKALGVSSDAPPPWLGQLAALLVPARSAPAEALPAASEDMDQPLVEDAVLVDPFAMSGSEKAAYLFKTDEDRERWEKVYTKTMKRYFARQAKVVLEKLNGAKTARSFARGSKVEAGNLLDEAVWARQLEEDMLPLIRSVQDEFGSIVATRAGTSFAVDAAEVELARQVQMARLLKVNGTTFGLIESALAEADAAGESIAQMSSRIAGIFDSARDYRSDFIARTEVLSASNQGLILAAKQSGVATTKTWISAADGRVRDSHVDADGQTVPLNQYFDVNGIEMEAPGDPVGPPEEVANCRCTMWFGTDPAADPDGPPLPTDDPLNPDPDLDEEDQ